MKQIKDYSGNLIFYTENEQKEFLNVFINSLILDLNIKLTKDEIKHIQTRMHLNIGKSYPIKHFKDVHSEIICNYKKYIPFCFASIMTAQKKMKDE